MDNIVFILGAGFNKDAKDEVGPIFGHSIYIGKHEIDCGYPLVQDLWKLCYQKADVDESKSFEDEMARSIGCGDLEPLTKLLDALFKADYYIVSKLAPHDEVYTSCYGEFFDRFRKSSFLTFNYDSFVEIFLLRRGMWNPLNGYGVAVAASVEDHGWGDGTLPPSRAKVIHLHGALCVFESNTELVRDEPSGIDMVRRKKVDFRFDPESIGWLFYPFGRVWGGLGDDDSLTGRVIAPVPDKGKGLTKSFIQTMYTQAESQLESSTHVVAIGYSFRSTDSASYEPLLRTVIDSDKTLCVVAPDAKEVAQRLEHEFDGLKTTPEPFGFRAWVKAGFPGAS